MPDLPLLVIVVVAAALVLDFLNGMNDAANSIATVVATRVLTPIQAVAWAALFNFAAAFFFGVKIAKTIGTGIVDIKIVTLPLVLSALAGAVAWVHLCTKLGLPISVSHALVGGIIGPALVVGGTGALIWSGVAKILVFIVLAPVLGLIAGYLLMVGVAWAFKARGPSRVERLFGGMQLLSSAAYSLSHGANDAQKMMGIIVMALLASGLKEQPANPADLKVEWWIILSCHAAIALGTLAGGWKVIETMGMKLTKLRTPGGFSAETGGALTLFGTAIAGIPVSTTHTITGAILGAGSVARLSAVRWSVARRIVWAWILTVPGTMAMAALCFLALRPILE